MVSTARAWQALLLSCMLGRVAMIPINVLLNTSAAVSPACKRGEGREGTGVIAGIWIWGHVDTGSHHHKAGYGMSYSRGC